MKNNMKFLQSAISFLLSLFWFSSLAATDPVAWSVLPAENFYPAETPVGSTSWAVYVLTNTLPRSVNLSTSYLKQGGTFNVFENCGQHTIASGASCIIVIEFAPTSVGQSNIQLTYGYHNNRIPLPTLIGTSIPAPPPTGTISGSISRIAPFSLNNPTETPQFTVTYTNTSQQDTVVGYAGDVNGQNLLTADPASVATVTVLPGSSCGTVNAPVTLYAGQQCQIKGQLTPVSVGGLTVSGLFTYNNSVNTSTPSTSTQVTPGGLGRCSINQMDSSASTGSALYLPSTTYQYSNNIVKFVFTNTNASQSQSLGQMNFPSIAGVTITPSSDYDTCSNQTLKPNESCYVMASVVPSVTTSSLIISANAPCGTGTTTAVTPAVSVTNFNGNTQNHNVVFVNQCPFAVWYEFANNSTTGGADPTPSGGSYQVNAPVHGVSTPVVLSVDEYLNGAIYARTGCDTSTGQCATGTCKSYSATDPMRCAVGVQPPNNLPLTKMELNMEPYNDGQPVSDGVYDVSLVNGFNLSAAIQSLAPASSSNLFGCGQTAGAVIQPPTGSGLGNCPWTFSPPNTGAPYITANFLSVTNPTPSDCTSSQCASGSICGVGYNSDPTINSINQGCSTFLGYWNIFSYVNPGAWGNVDLYTAFNLGVNLSTISGQNYGNNSSTGLPATYSDMWGCVVTTNDSLMSGYAASPVSTVCGCYQWDQEGSAVPTADGTCLKVNPDWTEIIYPYIVWLKKACPTAYSWNHDDPSSSFTCSNNSKTALTNYQITFCPGGQSGLFNGASEGRDIVP